MTIVSFWNDWPFHVTTLVEGPVDVDFGEELSICETTGTQRILQLFRVLVNWDYVGYT